ncbi:unnamed protein product [Calypogeia fissa]
MQASVLCGSSLDLAVSSKCSRVTLPPRSINCGKRIAGGHSRQHLRCSTLQKPFFVGDWPTSSLRFPSCTNLGPSVRPRPRCDPQTRALARFFVNGRKWGQKDQPNPQNPQNGGVNGALLNQLWVQKKGHGLLQKSAWVAAMVLMGGGALYGQAKARTYIEKTFLPPVAALVGKQFGRDIQLGKVQRLSPFGITLGPCSVGAHDEEFSCAEIPGVELRVLPIASLRKGQLVVDAVIAEPHILVSQKEDWTWLGIPIVSEEKPFMRHSSEPNLDSRTKVRRLAREEVASKMATERKRAARDSAKRGYKLPGTGVQESSKNDVGQKSRGSEKHTKKVDTELDDSENEEGIDTTSFYLGVDEADGIKAGQHVEERLTEADEANTGFELRNSVLGAKVWIDTNMLKPVKRRVLRRWTRQGLHAISKTALQRRNLDRSAAAARDYFQKLDYPHGEGGGAAGPADLNDVSAPRFRGNSQDSSMTGLRFDNSSKRSATLQSENVEKMDSHDDRVSNQMSPFSRSNRSTLPPMSLSTSWGARDDRKEEGRLKSALPNLKLQIDDAIQYRKGIEQVNFRKINGLRPSLRSLGRERRGSSDKRSDRKSVEASSVDISTKIGDNIRTAKSLESEERSSQVTIESVKEALVQAIRERQEKSDRTDRNGLKSSNQHSSIVSNPLEQSPCESEVLKSGKDNTRSLVRSQLECEADVIKFVGKKSSIYSLSESSILDTVGAAEFVGEDRAREQFRKESKVQHGQHGRNTVGDEKPERKESGQELRAISSSASKSLLNAHSIEAGIQNNGPVQSMSLETQSDYRSDMKEKLEPSDYEHREEEPYQVAMTQQTMESRLLDQTKAWTPVALNSVYFKDGTLMLLAFGDREPRVMERATGMVKFGSSYDQINVRVTGSPKEFRTGNINGDGGKIFVKVAIDLAKQEWHLKVRGRHLFAPLFEKLLEVPLDWSDGRASGEVHAWMLKDDLFPSFGGRVDVKGLDFAIWDAPAAFKGVNGTLFFQGQRLFFHNTSGLYGAIPLQVSGDMDLNPDDGEYRLSCQVSGVEANALMKTLKAQPPPFPLAGALKAVVHCRGPLDAPIFEGSAELAAKQKALVYEAPHTVATHAIKENEHGGAVAAYDRVPFASASASFTFNTDDCMAELYGVRAAPVGGGEIRGSGNLWICPEGELDPSAVNVDCSGQVATTPLLHSFTPAGMDVSSISFGTMHGEAKIRGALLMPVFDIKWDTPEAQGSFDGAHGDVHISREAISLNSSACTYDLSTKIHTLYPPILRTEVRTFEYKPAPPPVVEGLDLDLKLRGFDVVGLVPPSSSLADLSHMKVTGKVKFNGQVPKPRPKVVSDGEESVQTKEELKSSVAPSGNEISGLVGEVSLSGLKLNQLLVAPHLTGSLEVSPSSFKVHTTGRADEHLHVFVSKKLLSSIESPTPDSFFEPVEEGASFSLLRGQLRTDLHYQPGHSAKVEIRNLQLDELELASLRGAVQKAELALNFQKRRGQGSLSVRRPRGSGIQGESLDIAARWSGDVITLDKSVLEQASSRYELQGEYVLPSLRDRSVIDKSKQWEKAMGGQLGQMITSMGRWRLRLDVPKAEVSDMLPVARLLSRSSDPAVVSRSKEIFLQGVRSAGFSAENIKEQLEYIRQSNGIEAPEGSPESIPLPGLAELRGEWQGTLEASGGGDGDTYADFDLRGNEWEWGSYKTRKVIAIGDYCNNDGLRLQKFFIQKDTATLHADGTLLGPKPNLHFAVLNFPVDLVPPLLHAFQSASTPEPLTSPASRPYSTPIKGILYMEGDLRGSLAKPQCDVQIRLLDGAIGGVSLGKAEMAASVTPANRLAFNAILEPVAQTGHVRIQGNLPMGPGGLEEHEVEVHGNETEQHTRAGCWSRERGRERKDEDQVDKDESLEKGGEEGWEVRLAESLKALDGEFLESGAVQVDAAVKDGGMMLLTAISPGFQWIQGNADIKLQVRGTVQQPTADGTASFYKVGISSPVLPRPVSNLGGTIRIKSNQLFVEGLEGRVGRRGLVEVKGQLPLRSSDSSTTTDAIEVKAESLEVRARHVYSGQVNSNIRIMGSLLEPEVTGMIKLSHGEAYLSQEKGSSPSTISSSPPGGGYGWMTAASSAGRHDADIFPLPEQLGGKPPGSKEEQKDEKTPGRLPPIDVRLTCLKLLLGPELRMVYPLILNFAVSGELELNGFADSMRMKPKGTLTFENGDVNLVATQVRLNKDHPNRAKFEPEHGLDPTLDLALIGADWQLKVQGRARNWQDNIVVSSTRTGEQDALTRTEAARVFESQLAESLLEGDGQLAFKKLAAATVETLMPRIETKGEFGQARWRLVSAPQIPNLLSLDPTTDPFKSLANLSFGAEVEVQLGRHLQASVVRRIKDSEMATEWTFLYQLNSQFRLLFSSIPSVDNRLMFEFSATSQN